ncbi:hypothetical protein [Lactobacillus kimbladii]|uniref:hypothetical protein n=1 Tax=Lactobacillus kimbladii TaxID=1218506 RepID=UPI003AF54145
MQRFHYKNQEYDGLVIFPFDPNAKDNTMQLNEFAEIIGEGLLTKEKWKPIPTESNRNKIVPKTDLEKQLYNVSLKIANDEYSEENVKLFIKDHVIVDFDMLNYLITYVPQFKIIDS